MRRRAFLQAAGAALAASVAGAAFDPERALWVPGRRTFVDIGAGRSLAPQQARCVLRMADGTEYAFDAVVVGADLASDDAGGWASSGLVAVRPVFEGLTTWGQS